MVNQENPLPFETISAAAYVTYLNGLEFPDLLDMVWTIACKRKADETDTERARQILIAYHKRTESWLHRAQDDAMFRMLGMDICPDDLEDSPEALALLVPKKLRELLWMLSDLNDSLAPFRRET